MDVITGEGGELKKKKRSSNGLRQPVAIECAQTDEAADAQTEKSSAAHASEQATDGSARSRVGNDDVTDVMARFRRMRAKTREQSEPEQTIEAVVHASGEGSLAHDLEQVNGEETSDGDGRASTP